MRPPLTPERLAAFMKELAHSLSDRARHRVFIVGGGTALLKGWRASTLDLDLYSDDDRVFHDVQGIKERLDMNIEFARPEDFVPPLGGTEERHVFIDRVGRIDFFHYDPYAQLLSKIVRGFAQDLDDAAHLIGSGMVEPSRFRTLVGAIPDKSYAKYPALTKAGVLGAVESFLASLDRTTR